MLARGAGAKEARKFFGISISTEREVVLVEPDKVRAVLDAVVKAGRLDESAKGITFVLAIEEVTDTARLEGLEEDADG